LFCDCCFKVDIRIRRYTNKRSIEQNKHEQEHIYFEFVVNVMFDLDTLKYVVINLMFDFDISLFILSGNTIRVMTTMGGRRGV